MLMLLISVAHFAVRWPVVNDVCASRALLLLLRLNVLAERVSVAVSVEAAAAITVTVLIAFTPCIRVLVLRLTFICVMAAFLRQ